VNTNQNTDLYLYFALDNDLPAGGYLKIDFPATFVHAPTSCAVWELTDNVEVPPTSTDLLTGTLSGSSPFYCTLETTAEVAAGLKKNIAYGLKLAGTATVLAGAYAPIGL